MLAISCKQNADIHRKKSSKFSGTLWKDIFRWASHQSKRSSRHGAVRQGGFYILKKYQLSKEHVFHDIWTEICGAEPSKILWAEPC